MRDSILNSSKFFHIVDGLVPDVMHDILEGSLQYEVKELLKHFIHTEQVDILLSKNQAQHVLNYCWFITTVIAQVAKSRE